MRPGGLAGEIPGWLVTVISRCLSHSRISPQGQPERQTFKTKIIPIMAEEQPVTPVKSLGPDSLKYSSGMKTIPGHAAPLKREDGILVQFIKSYGNSAGFPAYLNDKVFVMAIAGGRGKGHQECQSP